MAQIKICAAAASAVICACMVMWLVLAHDSIPYSKIYNLYAALPVPDTTRSIPKVVCQTYYDASKIPTYVDAQFARFAANFERRIFDDGDAEEYVRTHYPRRVHRAYNQLTGPHRADLFRYCYLFREGGVYLDIKTVLCSDLEDVVNLVEKHKCEIATCLTEPTLMFPFQHQVYQGVIIALPGCAVFLECIEYAVRYGWRTRLEYFALIRNITARLLADNGRELKPGISRNGKYFFFREIVSYWNCHGQGGVQMPLLARSSKTMNCSIITTPAGTPLFGTRYPEYPWR